MQNMKTSTAKILVDAGQATNVAVNAIDNEVIDLDISGQEQVEDASSCSWSYSDYGKAALAFAGTVGMVALVKTTGFMPLFWRDSDATDDQKTTALPDQEVDNSQQLMPALEKQFVTYAEQPMAANPRHAKRAFGSEFQINTHTVNNQYRPSVATLTTDDFVVVWRSSMQDGDQEGVYGQRYSSTGVTQGGEFQINTHTTNWQQNPSVAALSTGDFVVVWQSSWQDGDDEGIYGQRFSSTGIPQSSEFQINTYTISEQRYPSVTGLSTGDFVVTWESDGPGGFSYGIYGQRYSSTGAPQGNEFQINTYTASVQMLPSVTALSTGDFVVTWTSGGQDGDSYGIYGQRYSSAGVAQGSEFQINTYTVSAQQRPAVTALSTGDFVVVWASDGQDGDSYGIYGQRYSSTGIAQDNEFQVNTHTTGSQEYPSVVVLSTDAFVVVWESSGGQDGDSYGIYGQRYSSAGVAQGSEFQINAYTTSGQNWPSVAALSTGDFVVTWSSNGQDGDSYGIYGRMYFNGNVPPTLVNNVLTIDEGQTVILSTTNLSVMDPDNNTTALTYTINSVQNGQFERVATPGTAITSFTHQEIIDGDIQFVHDGSENQPSYDVSVSDGALTYGPASAIITFNNVNAPVLGNNALSVNEGQTVILTTTDLSVTDSDNTATELTYTMSNVQNGQFECVATPGTAITSFTHQEIIDGDIQFVHDGSENQPSYDVSVSDGALTYGPASAIITFNNVNAPVLGNNALSVNEGQTVILTTTDLSVTDSDNTATELTYTMSNVQNGQFERVATPGTAITNFTHQEIIDGDIQFVHDGSENQPSYDVSVSDGALTYGPASAIITFNNVNDAPVLGNNALSVNEGQTVILTTTDLSVTDSDSTATELTYTMSNVQNGQFERVATPGTAIISFTHQEIIDGDIQFVHDGSENQPSYDVSVSDGALTVGPASASVTFNTGIISQGRECQINTYTTGSQSAPSVAALSLGGFVVVWESSGQDGYHEGIYGQRYSSTDVTLGGEFQINDYIGNQGQPSVVGLNTGGFVVVWSDSSNSLDSYGQCFSSTAVPQGTEFQINTYILGWQGNPSVAGLTTGDFVVAWQSGGQDGDVNGVYGQCYSSTGIPQGTEFQINTYTISEQAFPSIAALSSGGFVVVWASAGPDGSNYGIFGQRFSSIGVPQGSEFQINTYTADSQSTPSVAALSLGGFVVVWESYGQDGDGNGIFGQRLSSIGVPQGSEFQINTYTISEQASPSIAALSSGSFVVTWYSSDGQDGDSYGVYGQRFSSIGVPQGSEFQVNTYTKDYQYYPSVAGLSPGSFVVTWVSGGQDGDSNGIYGRIFLKNINDAPLLTNNPLTINEGETVVLSTTNFSALDPDSNASELAFTVSNVHYGRFERISNTGITITSFTQQDIIDGSIQFIHDGSENQPSYYVSVSDGSLNDGPAVANVAFTLINDIPRIATNAFPITQGQTVILNSGMFLATDPDNGNTQIRFLVTNVQHGQFEKLDNFGAAISEFTQEEVLTGKIQFVHDNSETAPSFDIAVTDGVLTTARVAGNMNYTNINNAPFFTGIVSLTIQEDQTLTLTPANLQATDADNADGSLVFTVSGITNGRFESSNNPGIAITSFTQDQVQNGEISFAHDGSTTAPSFSVTVSDGSLYNSNGLQTAAISFTILNDAAIITANTLTVTEGGTVTLTLSNLAATDEETAAGVLTFNVANMMHGQFEHGNNPGVPITSFSQQSIINGDIQFVHNGDEQAPSYDVTVTDGVTTSVSQAATINFTPTNDAPILVTNELTINQDATKILSRLNIEVTDDDNSGDELTIDATHIKNGYFSTIDNPNTPITSFTQQDINDGKVQFTQQGNGKPTYTLSVTDKDGATSTQKPGGIDSIANINLVPKAMETNLVPIVLAIAGGAALFTGGIAAGIVYFKKAQDMKTRKQNEFARKIRHHLGLQKVNNFDSEQGRRFVQAVTELSGLLLEEQGIDITNMDENRLDELASNIATSAKNKITPDTTQFWKKSKITIQEFEDNIDKIAQDNRLFCPGDDVNIPMLARDSVSGSITSSESSATDSSKHLTTEVSIC